MLKVNARYEKEMLYLVLKGAFSTQLKPYFKVDKQHNRNYSFSLHTTGSYSRIIKKFCPFCKARFSLK